MNEISTAFRPADRKNAIGQVFVFPRCPLYGVTEYGDVIRRDTRTMLRPARRERGGYLCVSLWTDGKGKTWFVHQIVAFSFHGPRPSPRYDAAHRDGNKLNNHYTNVRWATRSENEHDKVLHGTSNRGDRNGMSRAARKARGKL